MSNAAEKTCGFSCLLPGGSKRELVYRIPSAEAGGLSAPMLMFQNGTIIPPQAASVSPQIFVAPKVSGTVFSMI